MNDVLQPAAKWLDDAELFRQAVERTARDHGFAGELIEKDVFCSLVLVVLAANMPESVVFKGGTCLSKVYTDFYRLSEDLDFAIPVPLQSSRAERRRLMEPVKVLCDSIPAHCPQVAVLDPMRGANQSTQYIQTLGYQSRITGKTAQIKVEFGLREPTLLAPRVEPAGTLLVSPLTGRPVFPSFPVRVMALKEMWGEKIRAALCRREPAIRDFFDLDYALRTNQFDLSAPDLIALAAQKLAVPGNGPVQLTDERRAELERQIQTDLKPVLRTRDFEQFDLDRIWTALVALADRLKEA
ncbi:MAG: nucleotidyl transferase AbiEii/AbiGii toxin family protein [Verrucomicrobia bacterium]|nr:nucleotidyl transferase AbiEii/AbiGii toxin family protein [Verrucomicrobiota bacterium]